MTSEKRDRCLFSLFPPLFSSQDSKPELRPAGSVLGVSLWVTARSRAYLQAKETWEYGDI